MIAQAVTILRSASEQDGSVEARFGLAKALQSQFAAEVSVDKPDLQKLEPILKEALALHSAICKEYPTVPDYQSELGRCQRNIASVYEELKNRAASEASIGDAVTTYQRLVDAFPDVIEYRLGLANACTFLAEMLASGKRELEATMMLKQALPILGKTTYRNAQVTKACCGIYHDADKAWRLDKSH